MKRFFLIAICVLLAGCAARINGVADSNLYQRPAPNSSYKIIYTGQEDVAAPKIEKLLDYQIRKLGFTPASNNIPNMLVFFDYSVLPDSVVSQSNTSGYIPQQTSTVNGNQVITNPSFPFMSTTTSSTQMYRKTMHVVLTDVTGKNKFWEGTVSEVGWCNRIFVTTPNILVLMFTNFPSENTNHSQMLDANDPRVKEFYALFPGTNWGCK